MVLSRLIATPFLSAEPLIQHLDFGEVKAHTPVLEGQLLRTTLPGEESKSHAQKRMLVLQKLL